MALPVRTTGDTVQSPETLLDRLVDADFARLDQYPSFASVRQTLNSLLDTVMRANGGSLQWTLPPIDVYERHGKYYVECAVPGLKKEDIDVEIDDNRLTISAKMQQERKDENARYHFRELRRGSFSRTIIFPTNLDASKVQATSDGGLLKLEIPSNRPAQSKKVAIKG